MNTIKEILASVTHNPHYLNKYITFITNCQAQNKSYSGYTEQHHICPKADDMFPEFTSFKEFSWNCAKLTTRQHFIAHLLLYKAYPGVLSQSRATHLMSNRRSIKVNSKLYQKIKLEVVAANKNTISVKDSTGVTSRVSTTDSRYLSGELVSVSTGIVTVKNKQGKTFSVNKDDPLYLEGTLIHISKGRVSVKDAKGNTRSVTTDDPRYLSRELIPIATGRVLVKDIYGATQSVYRDNPDYVSGELTSINIGKVTVKDAAGNNFQVATDDPRYLSGELKFILKGRVTVKDSQGKTFSVLTNDPKYLSGELVVLNKGKMAAKDNEGTIHYIDTSDSRRLTGEFKHVTSGIPNASRKINKEGIQEMRIALKLENIEFSVEFLAQVLLLSDIPKIGKIPLNELRFKNGVKTTYKSLLAQYYSKKHNVSLLTSRKILNNEIYKEILV